LPGAAADAENAVQCAAITRQPVRSPLKLSRVHWVRSAVAKEVIYRTRTEAKVLRQVSYKGQREDKPAKQVVRRVPQPPRP
jgi:bifunctional non-homologous end joining protein LigD